MPFYHILNSITYLESDYQGNLTNDPELRQSHDLSITFRKSSVPRQSVNRPQRCFASHAFTRTAFSSRIVSSRWARSIFVAAIQLQRRTRHGESIECLSGRLHQWNADLHAEARNNHGRRWNCRRVSDGEDFLFFICILIESGYGRRFIKKRVNWTDFHFYARSLRAISLGKFILLSWSIDHFFD